MARGQTVGLLAPQLRPYIPLLAEYFPTALGADALIEIAAKENPTLLEKASASSAMWAANAATVSPSPDNADGKLHITTANLQTNLHRRIEASDTHALLAAIFKNVPDSVVHPPLNPSPNRGEARRGADMATAAQQCPLPNPPPTGEGIQYMDEGAANHMRLGLLNVFVYSDAGRQSLSASETIAKNHGVKHALFVKQNAEVIARGVFHNDVIAVSNDNVLLVHESAFADSGDTIRIAQVYEKIHGQKLIVITILDAELSVDEAVATYLFNSQIITKPDGKMAIIAPEEVGILYDGKAQKLLEKIRADASNPIDEIITLDLRQSMRNGGGPACLRLRVPMLPAQLSALQKTTNVIANDALLAGVEAIVEKYYPDELSASNLGNPELYHACQKMRDEMLALMKL